MSFLSYVEEATNNLQIADKSEDENNGISSSGHGKSSVTTLQLPDLSGIFEAMNRISKNNSFLFGGQSFDGHRKEATPPPASPDLPQINLVPSGAGPAGNVNISQTLEALVKNFRESVDSGGHLNDTAFFTLAIVYAIAIVIGLCGNLLIAAAVLGRKRMRTARNVFIVTLAISDLVLCVFTMPSTLWEVLYRKWPFGRDTEWLCRLANSGQTTPMFMSSFAIMAIALDRYRCIMQPDKSQLTARTSCIISTVMGLVAIGMSVPLFVGTELKPYVDFGNIASLSDILLCSDVRSGDMRLVYDVCRCFVQFVLPLLVVLGVYATIFCRLKKRPMSQHSENNRRRRRTNIMIISVSLVFFLSWLPLNTLNFMLDFKSSYSKVNSDIGGNDPLVYGVCTIMGLGNACINPVLYGYLNENFRQEYKSLYSKIPWHNSHAGVSVQCDDHNQNLEEARRSPSNRSLIMVNTVAPAAAAAPTEAAPEGAANNIRMVEPINGKNQSISFLQYLSLAKVEFDSTAQKRKFEEVKEAETQIPLIRETCV